MSINCYYAQASSSSLPRIQEPTNLDKFSLSSQRLQQVTSALLHTFASNDPFTQPFSHYALPPLSHLTPASLPQKKKRLKS